MRFFSKLFSKKKSTTGKDDDNATLTSSTTSKATRRSSGSESSPQTPKNITTTKNITPEAPTPPPTPPKPEILQDVHDRTLAGGKKFIDLIIAHNADGLKEIVTPSCMVCFAEQELPFDAYLEEAHKIFKAFSDFTIETPTGFSVEYDAKDRICCVARDCVASGTHDGAPYAFGPFEEVEITNQFVKNDPETYFFYINEEGKVFDFQIEAKEGDMTGPAGIYQQIGGFPVL